jgi:hypothetical protein
MPLADIKAALASRVKPIEICEDYQDILIATDENELVAVSRIKEHVEWAWSVGIIDDALMSMFTDAILVANNVFNTGSHTITNPGTDVFVLGDANVTVNSSGFNRCRIVLCSNNANLNIHASDNAHIKLLRKKCTSPVGVVLNDHASFIGELEDNGIVDVMVNNDSVFHARTYNECILNLSCYDNGVVNVKASHASEVFVATGPSANVIINLRDKSKATYVDDSML